MKDTGKDEMRFVVKYRMPLIKTAIVVFLLLAIIGGLFFKGYMAAKETYESRIAELETEVERFADPVAVYEEASKEVDIRLINSEIQDIGELATIEYLYTDAGKFEDPKQLFGKDIPFTTKSFIAKWDGTIKAGVDISEVTAEVNDFNKEIVIHIPKAEILSHAILQEDQKYVEFVFWMYERYIRFSADQIEGFAEENTVEAIRYLADELREKTEYLESGKIEKVRYIEECLWISLEAMIKLIASMASWRVDEDYAMFAQAVANYAFEYGRFILYRREQEILSEYIQLQYKLTEELEQKYFVFIKDLEEQSKQFYVLIDNAFAPDFRETFLNSIVLAHAAGVDAREILTDIDDVDSFFVE